MLAVGRLLLVEDDVRLSRLLVRVLTEEGYRVTSAADGERGLHLGLADEFDVVVLDRSLPGFSGLEVLRVWRSRGVLTPTLVLSALGSDRDRAAGLHAGAQDYVVKPFDVDDLVARVRGVWSC